MTRPARLRRRAAFPSLVIMAGVFASCGGGDGATDRRPAAGASGVGEHEHDHGDTAPAFARDDATVEVKTTLRDYAFVGIPPTARGPNVFFEATITGSNSHELDIVGADGESRGTIPPFKVGAGEQTLAVALEPGTYVVQCLVREGTRTHAQLGMRQELVVE